MAVKQAYTLKENLDTLPKLDNEDVNAKLIDLAKRGMKKRGLSGKDVYEKRIKEELDLITSKNFSIYFIILQDAIEWCRRNGILVGRGRGSSAASLLCYVLEITDVDPIEYGLLFWRFLSPWRQDWPDVDTDIADRDRHKLFRYLAERYGADKVSGITTFTYWTAKSAIKDACKVLAVPFKDANDLSKTLDQFCTIDDFRNVRYKEFHEKYPGVYKLAKSLVGRLQKVGYHAAARVITDVPTEDLVSIETRAPEGSKFREKVISLDKNDAEKMGLIKYDFLGLTTLSIVADCIQLVKHNHNKLIDLRNMSFDDPAVFASVNEGHTVGIFQSEGGASVRVIKEMGIKNFADMVVSNALPRSGAWDAMGPDYIAKKKGYKKPTYPTEESKTFLEETFGEMLYQEQMLLVCTEVAGLTPEESDTIRRLTAKKKDPLTLAPLKEKFIKGATKTTNAKTAEDLWKKIEISAKYQFNKCLHKDTEIYVKYRNIRMGMADESVESMSVERLYALMTITKGKSEFFVLGPEYVKDRSAGGNKWHKVKDIYDNGVQDIVRVWINERQYIDSTKTHKHRLSKGWKEAYRIHQMDRIATNAGMKTVWKKTWEGQAQTYDIELYDEPHAFYANGIITHNSHSVAYSQLSYITAMLKYYYPAEFMCSLLLNAGQPHKIVEYMTECNRLGIPVKTPDVNKSEESYVVKDGVIYMGLSNIWGISDTLAKRIIHMRDSSPKKEDSQCTCLRHGQFTSYADMIERMTAKYSKLGKKVIDSLNAVGATRFKDHPIDEEEIKNNFYEYLGIASFDNAQITSKMKKNLDYLSDYEPTKCAIFACIVKDITVKGWTRIDFIDESGSAGFFVDETHDFKKGQKYLIAVARNTIVGKLDLSKFTSSSPIVRYLNGEYTDGTWLIAAKASVTKTGKEKATMLYSYNGKLNEATVWSDMLPHARKCRQGDKIRIKVKPSPKWGNTLIAILKDKQ